MGISTPSRFGSLDADASFHLPIPGLLADLDSGSAGLRMTDEFLDLPPATRVLMVRQWMREFRDLQDAATVAWFREWSAGRPELSIVAQLGAFREHCAESGSSCPADLPLLLQRF